MSSFELGISSSDAVTLYPEWNYESGKIKIQAEHRTTTGALYQYKFSDYKRFDFSVNWIDSSVAALVNSWWDTNTDLLFFVTSGSATEVHSVHLMGTDTPLRKFDKPYDNYYKGKIHLEGY